MSSDRRKPAKTREMAAVPANYVSLNTLYNLLKEHFAGDGKLATEFLRDFAGLNLRVPPIPAIERFVKEMRIASSLNHSPNPADVRRLANLYSEPMRAVAKAFSKRHGKGLREARGKKPKPN